MLDGCWGSCNEMGNASHSHRTDTHADHVSFLTSRRPRPASFDQLNSVTSSHVRQNGIGASLYRDSSRTTFRLK
eukprot:scaffold331_cov191-Alexandrium_tamarense.AAC.31